MKTMLFLFTALTILGVNGWSDMIKEPNVAGAFYSADPKVLSDSINEFEAAASGVPTDRRVEIAISPHAGYPFSGPVAAYTYKAIAKNHYKTIIIIGPSHYVDFQGISVWPKGGFKTPLGIVPVDEDFSNQLLKENPEFQFLPNVYEREHAVEVELPFLQKTFKDFKIVPILMGAPDPQVCEDLAMALDKLIGDRQDVLILISSDMSHYYTYDVANQMDALTLKAIAAIDPKKFFEGNISRKMEMCGFVPVTTALMYARIRGINHVEVLDHANSGDTSGDKFRVVGYSSVIFYSGLLGQKVNQDQSAESLNASEKKELLKIARDALEKYVRTGKQLDVSASDERLAQVQGAFVTLTIHGTLRGCIGNIIGQEPLYETVRDMAIAAASQDPRFSPVTPAELKNIDIEISVLSVPRRIKDASEIILGQHGVIVSREVIKVFFCRK